MYEKVWYGWQCKDHRFERGQTMVAVKRRREQRQTRVVIQYKPMTPIGLVKLTSADGRRMDGQTIALNREMDDDNNTKK